MKQLLSIILLLLIVAGCKAKALPLPKGYQEYLQQLPSSQRESEIQGWNKMSPQQQQKETNIWDSVQGESEGIQPTTIESLKQQGDL